MRSLKWVGDGRCQAAKTGAVMLPAAPWTPWAPGLPPSSDCKMEKRLSSLQKALVLLLSRFIVFFLSILELRPPCPRRARCAGPS